MNEYDDSYGPIDFDDLADELGVSRDTVIAAGDAYAHQHGDRLTYADAEGGLPYQTYTGDAAAYVRRALTKS
jgi:hypothetical protein